MARPGKGIKPIYQIIREDLLREYEKTHCRQLPCESEICRKYQVCRPTVHKALEYFLEHQMIIRIAGKGSFFREDFCTKSAKIRKVVGIVRHDWESWDVDLYFCSVLQGLLASLGSQGKLSFEQFTPELTLQLLAAPDTASVWISPEQEEREAIRKLAEADQLTIAVNRDLNIPGVFSVSSDWKFIGSCAAAAFLRSGANRFCAVALEAESMMSEPIHEALNSALGVTGGNCTWISIPRESWKTFAEEEFERLLDAGERAFFLCSKSLLVFLLAGLRRRNLTLGGDVLLLVAGDDLNFEQSGISAIRQPMVELGRMAGRIVAGDKEADGGRITGELMRRASLPELNQIPKQDLSY